MLFEVKARKPGEKEVLKHMSDLARLVVELAASEEKTKIALTLLGGQTVMGIRANLKPEECDCQKRPTKFLCP